MKIVLTDGAKRPLIPRPDCTVLVPLGGAGGGYAVIDACDAPIVGRYNWSAMSRLSSGGYPTTAAIVTGCREGGDKRTTVPLHSLLMGCSRAGSLRSRLYVLDHIDDDPLNNRRNNLRWAESYWNRMDKARGVPFVPVPFDSLLLEVFDDPDR